MADTNEQFDADGNVLKVGNLTFVEGILGTGAYGTVRLARRTPSGTASSSTTPRSGKKRIRFAEHKLARSASAPESSSFFNADMEDSNHSNSMIIGTLELFVQRASTTVRSASSSIGFLFDEKQQQHEEEQPLVAVKILQKSLLKRMRTMERDKTTRKVQIHTAYEKVEREIALMKKMCHPNLVALHEVIDSPESDMLYMVLEYMPLGEILSYQDDGTFRRKDPKPGQPPFEGLHDGHFDEAHAALYFVDILHALAYLHQHHICHRDLKPENILLDARGIVKISDFGVSHFFEEEQSIGAHRLGDENHAHHPNKLTRNDTDSALAMSGMANTGMLTKTEGTWCFWSPEMCRASSAFSGYAADLWAAGVCLYIFVTGKLPFYSNIPMDLFEAIAEANVPYEGLGLSNTLIDLLKSTLDKDPTKRAGVGDCLKHPFLQVAREKRIRQLGAEFERSRTRKLVVGEEDIRRAFRIVTMVNPVVFLKSAQKQIKDGYKAARERLSLASSFSSQTSLNAMEEEAAAARTAAPRKTSILLTKPTMSSISDSSNHTESASPKKLYSIPQDRSVTDEIHYNDDDQTLETVPVIKLERRRSRSKRRKAAMCIIQ